MLSTVLTTTALLLLHASHTQAIGLTLDLCDTNTSCVAPRQCFDTSSPTLTACPPNAVTVCACSPITPQYCTAAAECATGELCARTVTTASSCMSVDAVAVNEVLFSITDVPPPVPPPTGEAPPVWQAVGDRNRGETCKNPLDCSSGLFCLSLTSKKSSRCSGESDSCRCVPRGSGAKCERSADCAAGKCVSVGGAQGVCLPKDVAEVSGGAILVNPPTTTPIVTPAPVAESPKPAASVKPKASVAAAPTPATQSTGALPSVTAIASPPPPPPSASASVPPASPLPSVTAVGPSMVPGAVPSTGTEVPVDETAEPTELFGPTSTPSSIVTPPGTVGTDSDDGDSPEESPEDEICIGVEHLAHLSPDSLVYREHRYARVLCDHKGSCATPGHMVDHLGEVMMMSSYCAKEGFECRETIKLVNSVKYSRKARLASRTDGLKFTALAARFATRMEEGLLVAAVRFGF